MPSLRPSQIDFNEIWATIKDTLERVLKLQKVTRSEWNERFSDVYAICASIQEGLDEKLYKETENFFISYTKDVHKNISYFNTNLLQNYHENWVQYYTGTKYINLIYRYLNDHYTLRQKHDYIEHIQGPVSDSDVMVIGQLALDKWKANVIAELKNMLINAVLNEIKKDRKGERPPESVVKGVINSFIEVQEYETRTPLKLYQTAFEEKLLSETEDFFRNEAAQHRESCNCSEYMLRVDTQLEEEHRRAMRYLHSSTHDKNQQVAQSKLVEDHLEMILSECKQMVKDKKITDLSRMYRLVKPIPKGFKSLQQEFEEFIAETGLSRVKALHTENETGNFVNVLLELHDEYTKLVEETFSSDQAFFGARDRAFTKIINFRLDPKKVCRSPELLAKYCDALLKKSSKNLPEGEIDEKLDNVIVIFKYLDDKDIFQKFYSKLLAKRLIHNMSVSMDTEEGMITKLKLACGYEYTNKLHRMFTDMTISSDLHQDFSQMLKTTNTDLGINFSLLVLQSGAWPLGQTAAPTVNLPQELVKSVQTFDVYYNGKYNGRKLTWLQHLSNGELKLTYLKKPYIVTVTTYQMAVLLLFNENDRMSFRDISSQCELEDKELKRTLQSVVDVRLLTQQGPDDDVMKCEFVLNLQFSNKRTKFKITAAVQKETPQEIEATHSSVDEDRKMYTQAAIVRIMKSRKMLKHNILIQEVVNQSRGKFSPTTVIIKKCIEALIEKNYIERIQGSRDEYSYVA